MSLAFLSPRTGALIVLAGMGGVIATVLGFQHIGGYIPCALCLQQRIPYYVAIPVLVVALVATIALGRVSILKVGLVSAGIAMVIAAGLGAYHAGVEWDWWAGPTTCGTVSGGSMGDAGSLLDQLSSVRPPSCDAAAGRFLGLSFAGWNVVASLMLAALAFLALRREPTEVSER